MLHDSDSDSSGDAEFVDNLFPENDVEDAAEVLLNALGLTEVNHWSDIGDTSSIDPDGNCGHRSCMKGIIVHAAPGSYNIVSNVLPFNQQRHSSLDNINTFRHGLYTYLSRNWQRFTGDFPSIQDAAGNPLPDYNVETRRQVMENVGSIIDNRQVDFSGGCSSEYWFDTCRVLPLVAHMYKQTFVSYSDSYYIK